MKKNVLYLMLILCFTKTFAQGIDTLIVEKIPVSAVAALADANLTTNMYTYRVFIDLEPGYYIESVLGTELNALKILTTTMFYNDVNDGDLFPSGSLFRTHPTADEPQYYDSWITIGAYGDLTRATSASQIVPLGEDLGDGIQDGFILTSPPAEPTLDPATNLDANFNYEMGVSFSSDNVIWYAAGGVPGIGASNSVCIGQFTTDGEFTMELSVRINNGSGSIQYIAREKIAEDQVRSDLMFYPFNYAPEVEITSPANGTEYTSGDSIFITAGASDPAADDSIAIVQFYVNDVQESYDLAAPYTFAWKSKGFGNAELTAVAFDGRGSTDTSGIINISLNMPPAISFVKPTKDTLVTKGDTLDIVVNAGDVDGSISYVAFYNGNDSIGYDDAAPYQFSWFTADVSPGLKKVKAKAVDNKNAFKYTLERNITIEDTEANDPPVITFIHPDTTEVVTIGRMLEISADVTDNDVDDTITVVEFYLDNSKIGEDNTSPYGLNWTASGFGNKKLSLTATDSRGAKGYSDTVLLILNRIPSLIINSPETESQYALGDSVHITGFSADPDAGDSIQKTEVFINNGKIKEFASGTFDHKWKAVGSGNQWIKVISFDSRGSIKADSVMIIINAPPQITLVSPENNSSFTESSTVTISAEATDDGSISNVEFFVDDVKAGEDNSSPYSYDWSAEAGAHTIKATATDNHGEKTTSGSISITVNAKPQISIISPTNGSAFVQGENVEITLEASVSTGSIEKVEVYANEAKISELLEGPYAFTWKKSAGVIVLKAIAYDDNGGSAESDSVTIDDLVGIHSLNENPFYIWPNPVKDVLSIELTGAGMGKYYLQITDLSGKVVKQHVSKISENNDEAHLDISELNGGMYVLKIYSKNHDVIHVIQIVKQ